MRAHWRRTEAASPRSHASPPPGRGPVRPSYTPQTHVQRAASPRHPHGPRRRHHSGARPLPPAAANVRVARVSECKPWWEAQTRCRRLHPRSQRSKPEGCARTLGRISGLAGVVGGMQHTRLRADARHARQHWARRVPCPVEIHGLICEATSPPSAPSCSPARRGPIGTSDPTPWRSARCASAASSSPWAGAWAWLFPPKVNS